MTLSDPDSTDLESDRPRIAVLYASRPGGPPLGFLVLSCRAFPEPSIVPAVLEISCAFATSPSTPDHVVVAERLGYRNTWLYDSPALYPDVWSVLALAATRTSRIGLGPGVLIPSLRHPMVNAAAIATLVSLAPGRVNVAIGSGFTGRMTMGQRPLSWTFVRKYVTTLQALLRGEAAEWDGAMIQMMHPAGFAPPRPIDVPMILGIGGPKGRAVADELADGVFVAGRPLGPGAGRCVVLTFGTVLGEDEDPGSPRVLDAAGHAAGVALHAIYERRRDVAEIAGSPEWLAELEEISPELRHIALHEGHLVELNERDAKVVTGDMLRRMGYARSAGEWRDRLAELEAAGATEIAYQPAGSDIPGELERFAQAAGL
jgi:5,10-methylenetetrahydromethanopterin reductase